MTALERCNTKYKEIVYAASYLERTAALMFQPQTDMATWTFKHASLANFFKELRAPFDEPDARRMVERKFMELRHNNKHCASYYTTFTTYLV